MLNKWIGLGRLTRDPDLRFTKDGKPVANITLAVNRKKSNNEDAVSFIDVTIWGEPAKVFTKFHFKGDLAYIEGRLDQETWEADGGKRSKLKVTCEIWRFASEITGHSSKRDEPKQDRSF